MTPENPALLLETPILAAESFDEDHHNVGEAPDGFAQRVAHLTYGVLKEFPDFAKRHRGFIGTLEVASLTAVTITSGVIIRRLLKAGPDATDDMVLHGLTEAELSSGEKPQKFVKPDCNGKNTNFLH